MSGAQLIGQLDKLRILHHQSKTHAFKTFAEIQGISVWIMDWNMCFHTNWLYTRVLEGDLFWELTDQ